MTPTPGALRHFVTSENKAVRFCWRMAARDTIRAVKRKFSKSAADHQDQAETVTEFLIGGYHNVECR